MGSTCTSGVCPSADNFPGSVLINSSRAALINGWVGTPTQRWTLCYRRSTHGASASTFHTRCDGLGPSVTVLSNSAGRLFGGYAATSWNTGNTYFGNASSFLFSLTNQYRHNPPGVTSGSYYQYSQSSYAPTFGGGHDLHVDLVSTGSYCNIGHTYSCRVGSYGNDSCRTDFCGLYSGWTVTELEVWVRQ